MPSSPSFIAKSPFGVIAAAPLLWGFEDRTHSQRGSHCGAGWRQSVTAPQCRDLCLYCCHLCRELVAFEFHVIAKVCDSRFKRSRSQLLKLAAHRKLLGQ